MKGLTLVGLLVALGIVGYLVYNSLTGVSSTPEVQQPQETLDNVRSDVEKIEELQQQREQQTAP